MTRMTEGPQHPDQPEQPQPPQQGQPAPYPGFGQQPHPSPPPYGEQGWADGNDLVPPRRPGTVTTACILAWVFGGIALVLSGWMLVGGLVDRDRVLDQMAGDTQFEGTGIDPVAVFDYILVMAGISVVLSGAGVALAVLAFKGSNAGRVGLAVCAGLAILVSLGTIMFCIPVLHLAASVAALVLLFTGGASAWYGAQKAT